MPSFEELHILEEELHEAAVELEAANKRYLDLILARITIRTLMIENGNQNG